MKETHTRAAEATKDTISGKVALWDIARELGLAYDPPTFCILHVREVVPEGTLKMPAHSKGKGAPCSACP